MFLDIPVRSCAFRKVFWLNDDNLLFQSRTCIHNFSLTNTMDGVLTREQTIRSSYAATHKTLELPVGTNSTLVYADCSGMLLIDFQTRTINALNKFEKEFVPVCTIPEPAEPCVGYQWDACMTRCKKFIFVIYGGSKICNIIGFKHDGTAWKMVNEPIALPVRMANGIL